MTRRTTQRLFRGLGIGAVLLALGVTCGVWSLTRQARLEGARLLGKQQWAAARSQLEYALRWSLRSDPQLRLWLAEAYAQDDELPPQTAAQAACLHLSTIPATTSLAAEARFREGQIRFLILHQSSQGERLLREAIQLQPHHLGAQTLLWKLLDVTGRQPLTHETFWQVYELTPPAERVLRLRDWFMSEFSPGSANVDLDRHWGVLPEGEAPTVRTVLSRYQLLAAGEPESPVAPTAIARWMLTEGNTDQAQHWAAIAEKAPTCWDDANFIALKIELAIEQGHGDVARDCWKRWPKPHSGYDYHRWDAVLLQEYEQQPAQAVTAITAALSDPAGDSDWLLRFRQANCLRQLGQTTAAHTVRTRAIELEKLINPETIKKLRRHLIDLNQAAGIRALAKFYRDLGRTREAAAWEVHLRNLSVGSRT